jgi:hypothetical protein
MITQHKRQEFNPSVLTLFGEDTLYTQELHGEHAHRTVHLVTWERLGGARVSGCVLAHCDTYIMSQSEGQKGTVDDAHLRHTSNRGPNCAVCVLALQRYREGHQ